MTYTKQLSSKLSTSLFCFLPFISFIFAPSSSAMTIASSEAEFGLNNFSAQPLAVDVDAFTVSFSNVGDATGTAETDAKADAIFEILTPRAISETRSSANGQGDRFFGLADSSTEVLGSFAVEADEVFSFDFDGFFNLSTSNESADNESALAAASFSLVLVDETDPNAPELVSFFDLFAQLDTVGSNDILIAPAVGNGIVLDAFNTTSSFGATNETEFINTDFAGSFAASFDAPTSLTLVQLQNSFALVETTPESSSWLATIVIGSLGFVTARQRRIGK